MTNLAKDGSRAFLFVLWVLLGATFADAGNLDDLIVSGIVIHDDEDLGSAASQQMPPLQLPYSQHGGKAPSTPVRVIVDQDSPSLAADADVPAITSGQISKCGAPVALSSLFQSGPLHIRLRTLII